MEMFECAVCDNKFEINTAEKPPYICPHCQNPCFFLFTMKTTFKDIVEAIRAQDISESPTFEMFVTKEEDGVGLLLKTNKTKARGFLLDQDNKVIGTMKA